MAFNRSWDTVAETWEAVAFRGIFSYRVRSTVCPRSSVPPLRNW